MSSKKCWVLLISMISNIISNFVPVSTYLGTGSVHLLFIFVLFYFSFYIWFILFPISAILTAVLTSLSKFAFWSLNALLLSSIFVSEKEKRIYLVSIEYEATEAKIWAQKLQYGNLEMGDICCGCNLKLLMSF